MTGLAFVRKVPTEVRSLRPITPFLNIEMTCYANWKLFVPKRAVQTEVSHSVTKTRLLLRILAVIGRYGSLLMIVVIFVTQNNFENGPGISDLLLGFYRCLIFPHFKTDSVIV